MEILDMTTELITRTVCVNRQRSAQAALKATGRVLYLANKIADEMPRGTGKEVEIIFFNKGCRLSDEELEQEYELLNLQPADPFALAALNECDPSFADEYPNATHWKDAKKNWCFAAFCLYENQRRTHVDRRSYAWTSSRWFAGVRK